MDQYILWGYLDDSKTGPPDLTILAPSLNRQKYPRIFQESYVEGELNEVSTIEDFSVVRQEGNREVRRTIKHYNLDLIIAVDYRVNPKRATVFRQWAIAI